MGEMTTIDVRLASSIGSHTCVTLLLTPSFLYASLDKPVIATRLDLFHFDKAFAVGRFSIDITFACVLYPVHLLATNLAETQAKIAEMLMPMSL